MTDEISDYDEQLEELISKVRSGLDNDVPRLTGKAKIEKLDYLKGRVERIKQVFHSYKVELRELSKADARPFEEKARDHEVAIAALVSELQQIRESTERDVYFSGGKTVEEMSNKEVVQTAQKIQAESKKVTERGRAIVEETIEIGAATSKALKDQTEQLERIDKSVDVVDSNLKQAEKQLRILIRRFATDKLIVTLVCIVILGVIACIIVGALRARGLIGSQPDPTPSPAS